MATLDIYQAVTDRIIELLEQGTVPWKQPIRSQGGSGRLPTNLLSHREYRGINVFLLAVTAWAEGYESPYWLTFKQTKEKGGHVRKGEKGSLVIFWKQHATEDKKTGEPIKIPVLRRYTVFNTDQCDGIELPSDEPGSGGVEDAEPPEGFTPIRECAEVVAGYAGGPTIEHRGGRALYSPRTDTVRIAEPDRFETREAYYATLFHELVHSTGHSTRLDRGLDRELAPFGSPDYSKEELVAEMGAAFLAAASGIGTQTIEQSASYIDGWRKKLGQDKKLIINAAAAGQRAADLITGALPYSQAPAANAQT
ncbi:MAG: DUF1738 domain-containing protein [Phycisphaerales bacterium]|nr:DUF1738 domain-containing protein [Phycisphaerales bacterium]MCB9836055.1 DUF1738 domain-containing protein [Phycisphaera sp.]